MKQHYGRLIKACLDAQKDFNILNEETKHLVMFAYSNTEEGRNYLLDNLETGRRIVIACVESIPDQVAVLIGTKDGNVETREDININDVTSRYLLQKAEGSLR